MMNIKTSPEEFDQLCHDYITALYQGVSGFISYRPGEKEAGEEKKVYLTYGEILYPSVNKIIGHIGDISEDDVFYDLGSGIGKVGLQFLLKTPVKKVRGIEYSEARNKMAEKAYAKVHKEFPEVFEKSRQMDCIVGNFLEQDLSDATLVYTCSTCFSDGLLADIGAVMDQCPNLRYLVSMKQIPNQLPLDTTLEIECTWDKTKCYVYARK